MAVYTFLNEQREWLSRERQEHATIGVVRSEVQRLYRRHLLYWLHEQFQSGVEPEASVSPSIIP